MGLKHWNNIRSQDFISIALSGKRSVTEVKWRLVTEWYAAQIIKFAPPDRSTSLMQQVASLTFWRLQTLIRPSAFEIHIYATQPVQNGCINCYGNSRKTQSPDQLLRLRENGLRARRPFRGPLLTPRERQQRLAWARTHLAKMAGSVVFGRIPFLYFECRRSNKGLETSEWKTCRLLH
jgi:hypothetical protein